MPPYWGTTNGSGTLVPGAPGAPGTNAFAFTATGAPASLTKQLTLPPEGATGFDIDSGKLAEDEYGLVMRFN